MRCNRLALTRKLQEPIEKPDSEASRKTNNEAHEQCWRQAVRHDFEAGCPRLWPSHRTGGFQGIPVVERSQARWELKFRAGNRDESPWECALGFLWVRGGRGENGEKTGIVIKASRIGRPWHG